MNLIFVLYKFTVFIIIANLIIVVIVVYIKIYIFTIKSNISLNIITKKLKFNIQHVYNVLPETAQSNSQKWSFGVSRLFSEYQAKER